MAASAVAPSKVTEFFYDNTGTMATIRTHVTQLYALVTSPHVESVYSLDKLRY